MANMTQARATRASIKALLGLVASKRRQGFKPIDLLDVIKMQLTSTNRDVSRLGRENAVWYLVPHGRIGW